MTQFEKDMEQKQKAAEKNKADGAKFEENKRKKEKLASGLQYKALKDGTGSQPKG
jgi:FKBP-type peptidyl-prolyl cis-trans isomerase